MITKKRTGLLVSLLVLIAAFIMVPAVSAVTAEDRPTWNWSKNNPKPGWFEWGEKYSKDKPVRGGYFRKASSVYIGLFNPNHWPVNDWVAIADIYENLVYTDGTYKPQVPWLASSWEFMDETTVITKLRQGVEFHDGSAFNADSMKYTLDWIMNKKNGAWSRAYMEPVQSIEAVDKYTLKWKFKRPFGAFMAVVMGGVPGIPLSKKALITDAAIKKVAKLGKKIKRAKKKIAKLKKKGKAEKAAKQKKALVKMVKDLVEAEAAAKGGKAYDKYGVGTGVYMMEEASPGNFLKLKRNPNWWFGQSIGKPEMPYFDGTITHVIPDPGVRLANLRANKLDYISPDVSQYELVRGSKKLAVHTRTSNFTMGLTFNQAGDRPARDIRVRKAISHAIDRKAIVHGVLFGMAREASSLFPGDHWAHNPNLKPITFDPELSKKLLAEAGYKNGLTLTGTWSNSPGSLSTAEAIKGMLANVGINWKVELLEFATIVGKAQNLEYDLMGLLWPWIWDPDGPAHGMYHPKGTWNFGRNKNDKAIKLVEAGRSELNFEKRAKIYHELESVIHETYEDIFISWATAILVYSKNVKGYNNAMDIDFRQGYYFSHPMWFKDGKN